MSNTAPASTPTPKKRSRTLVIAAALVVLAGGGGAAYWTFGGHASSGAAHAEEQEPAHEEASPAVAIPLETFVVNLAGSGRMHYLRVTLSLVVADPAVAAEVDHNEVVKMRVRSAILELLATQMADRLVTSEGKTELKAAIAEGAAKAFAGLHVTDVLFSEFVVQF